MEKMEFQRLKAEYILKDNSPGEEVTPAIFTEHSCPKFVGQWMLDNKHKNEMTF